jgi:hypothetical protein
VTRKTTKVLAGVAVTALAAAGVAAVVNHRRGQRPDPEECAHLDELDADSPCPKNRTTTPDRAASGASLKAGAPRPSPLERSDVRVVGSGRGLPAVEPYLLTGPESDLDGAAAARSPSGQPAVVARNGRPTSCR